MRKSKVEELLEMIEKSQPKIDVQEQVQAKEPELVTFMKHKETGVIHLFPSKKVNKVNKECVQGKEFYCSPAMGDLLN